MVTKQRLLERSKAWRKKQQENFDIFQSCGEAVYQSRARKYEEYADIADQALASVDDHERVLHLESMIRRWYSIVNTCGPDFKQAVDLINHEYKFRF